MGKEATWATEKNEKSLENSDSIFPLKSYRNLAAKNLKKNIEKQKMFKTSF